MYKRRMDGKDDRYEWIKRDEKIPVWTFTEGNTNYCGSIDTRLCVFLHSLLATLPLSIKMFEETKKAAMNFISVENLEN